MGRGRDPASIGWGLPEHLGSWSTELKAVAAAFYETGYALSPGELTSSAANWTGLVYLVAGWPGHDPGCSEAGQTDLDGFRPTINASDGELALIVDGDTAVPECLEGADLAALSAAVPYARGASCALVVGSGSTGFFRSIVIFYFRTKEDAARARLRLLNGEGGSRIEHLRDAMSDEAARDWFDILAGFRLRLQLHCVARRSLRGWLRRPLANWHIAFAARIFGSIFWPILPSLLLRLRRQYRATLAHASVWWLQVGCPGKRRLCE